MSKIIVLTGGNKGIGKGIAYALLQETSEPITLYLTARSPSLGEAAVAEIKASGSVPKPGSSLFFHQLDITSQSSVDTFSSYLKDHHKEIHVLINNAGIAPNRDFSLELVEEVVGCNYTGTARVCDSLIPLIHRPGGRVVNVSSGAGHLTNLSSESLRAQFRSPALTRQGLEELMSRFKKDTAEGTCEQNGWQKNAYRMSKVGMTALSMVLARQHPDLLINALCPGWVKTDMAPQGTRTVEQGARTPVFLAIEENKNITGEMWRDEQIVEW